LGDVGHEAEYNRCSRFGSGNLLLQALRRNPLRAPVTSTHAPGASSPARSGPTLPRKRVQG
jgi:hypothetical protein